MVQTVAAASVPDGWMILDIGSDSIQAFNASLDTAKTVLHHGSLGVYNFDKFEHGTEVCVSLTIFCYYYMLFSYINSVWHAQLANLILKCIATYFRQSP